jgi:hypothetical protein
MKNENTLLINTLNNTLHTLRKRIPMKKQLSINRVKREINNVATHNFYITAQQKTPIIIKHYLHVSSGARGGVVVKALCYKPAGRRFDSR